MREGEKRVVFHPHECTVWPQAAGAAQGRRGGNTGQGPAGNDTEGRRQLRLRMLTLTSNSFLQNCALRYFLM